MRWNGLRWCDHSTQNGTLMRTTTNQSILMAESMLLNYIAPHPFCTLGNQSTKIRYACIHLSFVSFFCHLYIAGRLLSVELGVFTTWCLVSNHLMKLHEDSGLATKVNFRIMTHAIGGTAFSKNNMVASLLFFSWLCILIFAILESMVRVCQSHWGSRITI